ncbi:MULTISPECIES: hypothetical protein [unclassified Arsukibacterium]|uniref:hypothetical protein n=1 Tax=unclassified Arsukibacterium TaxID=2635278 RepID=UPI000C8B8809|nr:MULTISPECIES: hypothetical protein [unclassified Arsukibacterium]MAA94066.1 hypothetical protein [Rheinheimera sp.]HAW93891.1 hypothetical protein [Candidatus Azambacteria bacterium]|tara:strand:+ start:54886 stop:55650 length:765 start_codon:yes stop_codon:yes gene_type:complete
MLLPLIISLIVALVIIAVVVNVVQQHKAKIASLKRAEFTKLRHMLDDTEDMLINAANVPLTPALSNMLLKRSAFALRAMVELDPGTRELKQRLQEIENRLKEPVAADQATTDNLTLPDNDQQLIGLIRGIKKLRTTLRSEHARGNIDTSAVVAEDKRLEILQLRINVESQIKRGKQARSNNMLGSARQYFEKALTSLNGSAHPDEYVINRKAEVTQTLEDIATELKAGNLRDREKKEEKENKDIDELFAPKRKW